MAKAVDDMTLEEIQEERAKIRAERVREAALDAEFEEQEAKETAERVAAVEKVAKALREEEDAPASWPHQHLSHVGLELDVRTPNASALMAISMLQQLDGHGELQMEIFNTFLFNHLSPQSLTEVIKEMTRPDSEITMQGLVQALVSLRTEAP